MIDQEIQAVFFDADDTLFSVRDGVASVYRAIMGRYGVDASEQEVAAALAEVWGEISDRYHNSEDGHRTTPDREREIWKEFCFAVVERIEAPADFDRFFDELYHYFAKGESRTLKPYLVELLEALRGRSLLLGVLTNNDARVYPVLKELDIRDYFDFVFPASEIGFKKPSPECFDEVRSRANVPAKNLLYIGDSLEIDYHAALQSGWQAILYNPVPAVQLENVVQIECFSELLSL